MSNLKNISVAVVGLGWMGQAHSRSLIRIPTLFPERKFNPILTVCADFDLNRGKQAV
ncbi:MAG: gfo/Idh/MocA family oxidoreductase, partial [Actinobacteria bacterium]|nr:gfo/Idh/MocA family oxidoreductase [Actinomycetota bacterium]